MTWHICGRCRWLEVVENSKGEYIPICVKRESPCYLMKTDYYTAPCSEWEEENYGL